MSGVRVLHLNPGSAGPRRFRLPVALARLVLEDDAMAVETIDLLAPPGTGTAVRSRAKTR